MEGKTRTQPLVYGGGARKGGAEPLLSLLAGLWYPSKEHRLHTQVRDHSPVSSCQKTHSGVAFLCNDTTRGPD